MAPFSSEITLFEKYGISGSQIYAICSFPFKECFHKNVCVTKEIHQPRDLSLLSLELI